MIRRQFVFYYYHQLVILNKAGDKTLLPEKVFLESKSYKNNGSPNVVLGHLHQNHLGTS